MRQKILFVTRSYLFQNNGGSNASKAFINAFASIFADMTLVYPENEKGKSDGFIPTNIKKVPIQDCRSNILKGLDMYRGRLLRFFVPVKKILNNEKYHIVIFDNSITSLGLIKYAKKMGARIIIIHHNVELEYLKDNPVNILYSLPYRYYVKKAEKDALLNSNLNLTLTNEDAGEFGKMFPGKDLHLNKIGVFEYTNTINKSPLRHDNTHGKYSMVFVISGSLYFKQSETPLVDFLENYFPLMKKQYPDAKLIITGRNPSERLYKIVSKLKDVDLIPNPEDINAVIARAHYYICPINVGSGQKLRVLDGLKQGLPAIVHFVSARGYEDLVKKNIIFKYNDSITFLKAIDDIVSSQISSKTVYEEYLRFYSFEAGISKIKDALQKGIGF